MICHLLLLQAQRYYMDVIESDSYTLTTSTVLERRLNAVQTRYQRASEGLARLRRITAPTPLQINIGGQQVNVVGRSIPKFLERDESIVDVPQLSSVPQVEVCEDDVVDMQASADNTTFSSNGEELPFKCAAGKQGGCGSQNGTRRRLGADRWARQTVVAERLDLQDDLIART
jgi:hypothetical protein